MEYDIWHFEGADLRGANLNGLNPCFNGIWYLTSITTKYSIMEKLVLILVLMEYDIWLFYGGQVTAVF